MNQAHKIISQNLDKIDIEDCLLRILSSQLEANPLLKRNVNCANYEETGLFIYYEDPFGVFRIKIYISTNLEISKIEFERRTRMAKIFNSSLEAHPPVLSDAQVAGIQINNLLVYGTPSNPNDNDESL